jgi:YebC/PmpR family DNA-binding regulatory protein
MAGHSKWKNIKHKKAASDAVKGRVFSRIAKEMTICARSGGGDPSSNITLRTIIAKARAANMPADNIDRAIKRGTGEIAAAALEEIVYEGFAPGGVAIIVQTLTDNRNRTSGEVRHLFTKFGGNIGLQNSVTRSFKRRGQIMVKADGVSEDQLLEVGLEAGAEDVIREGDMFEVLTAPAQFHVVLEALTKAGIKPEESEITMIPDMFVKITDKDLAAKLIEFVEALEENDDVQNVYTNLDIDDALMEAVGPHNA